MYIAHFSQCKSINQKEDLFKDVRIGLFFKEFKIYTNDGLTSIQETTIY